MKDVNGSHRDTEAQRAHREKQVSRSPLRHLCASASLWWILFFALFTGLALAKEAEPLAPDEATEQRLIAISSELRCLVCQNESLAGSNAELANDLRREIRELIKVGKSDAEIRDFLVKRYGDFVLYRPPLKGVTLALWFGPALLLASGLVALILYLRRRNQAISDAPLSAGEQGEADRLLKLERPQQ
jgi:cytochrome c-type biogenesis protein CcmH